MNEQQLPSLLEAALQKLKHVSGKYSSKSALGELAWSPESALGESSLEGIAQSLVWVS